MRHAESADPWDVPESSPHPELSDDGLKEARAVARRMAGTIRSLTDDVSQVGIVHPPTGPAAATAAIVAEALADRFADVDGTPVAPITWPSDHLRSNRLKPAAGALVSAIPKGADTPDVLIAVGHDPELGHQLHKELAFGASRVRARVATRIPLRRGEAAMVDCSEESRSLAWVVSPGSADLISELQTKVKSKMDTAKVFGAFLTAFTGLAISELTDGERSAVFSVVGALGIIALAFAVICYMITMFLYDSLLMPTDQWPSHTEPDNTDWFARLGRRASALVGTGQSPVRPPSSAATVIFHSMQRVWGGLFIPATCAAGVGMALVAVALVEPVDLELLAMLWAFVLIAVAAYAFAGAARPRFGSND